MRKHLVDAALFARQCDLAGVAFSWCLAFADRHPARDVDHQLFWEYRRVINSLSNFPEVSRAPSNR